jgi:phage tail-like protein
MPEESIPLLNNQFTINIDSPKIKFSRSNLSFESIGGIQSNSRASLLSWFISFLKGKTEKRITLRRAIDTDHYFHDWHSENLNSKKDLRTLTVIQLSPNEHEPINAWRFYDCWPDIWQGPGFDAINTAIAYETITIGYRSFIWLDKHKI